jgi:hypothetical protein
MIILRKSGYYTGIISGNISQQIQVDSVQVDIGQYPYYFRCYAMQSIVRQQASFKKPCNRRILRNVSRSDNNPHGFLIERWATIENRDIKTATVKLCYSYSDIKRSKSRINEMLLRIDCL